MAKCNFQSLMGPGEPLHGLGCAGLLDSQVLGSFAAIH